MICEEIISVNDVDIIHIPRLFDLPLCQFEKLWSTRPAEYGKFMFNGKPATEKRMNGVFSEDINTRFNYAGMSKLPIGKISDHDILMKCLDFSKKDSLERFDINIDYKFIFVNYYKDGNEMVSSHADRSDGNAIYSYTFFDRPEGHRDFNINNFNTNTILKKINLGHGDCLIMPPGMQKVLKHSVPKRAKCDYRRINITVRS